MQWNVQWTYSFRYQVLSPRSTIISSLHGCWFRYVAFTLCRNKREIQQKNCGAYCLPVVSGEVRLISFVDPLPLRPHLRGRHLEWSLSELVEIWRQDIVTGSYTYFNYFRRCWLGFSFSAWWFLWNRTKSWKQCSLTVLWWTWNFTKSWQFSLLKWQRQCESLRLSSVIKKHSEYNKCICDIQGW